MGMNEASIRPADIWTSTHASVHSHTIEILPLSHEKNACTLVPSRA